MSMRWPGSRTGHRILLVQAVALLASVALAPPGRAQTGVTPGPCVNSVLPSGALSLVCVPSAGWNGNLVVWAHGYVASGQLLDFHHHRLFEGADLSEMVQGLGFAFATTSYRSNGLVVLEALDDVRELAEAFHRAHGRPRIAYIVGASEGGLVSTLLLERHPGLFDGGLAACGPIGDFLAQLHHVAGFRVLFDYFFPGVIPGSPLSVPQEVMDRWESHYTPAVADALAASPLAARELMAVSGLRPPSASVADVQGAASNVLWYSVFATNDAISALGGNPYDNVSRWYSGSEDDEALNSGVQRFSAEPGALVEVARYETSGVPPVPLVIIHNTGDEVVPHWHVQGYGEKGDALRRGLLQQINVHRPGHCNFTSTEILIAAGLLMQRVGGAAPAEGR